MVALGCLPQVYNTLHLLLDVLPQILVPSPP